MVSILVSARDKDGEGHPLRFVEARHSHQLARVCVEEEGASSLVRADDPAICKREAVEIPPIRISWSCEVEGGVGKLHH